MGTGVCSLLTEPVHGPPVLIGDSKPLTVPWTNVDIHGTEIIVLLVTWGGQGGRGQGGRE